MWSQARCDIVRDAGEPLGLEGGGREGGGRVVPGSLPYRS